MIKRLTGDKNLFSLLITSRQPLIMLYLITDYIDTSHCGSTHWHFRTSTIDYQIQNGHQLLQCNCFFVRTIDWLVAYVAYKSEKMIVSLSEWYSVLYKYHSQFCCLDLTSLWYNIILSCFLGDWKRFLWLISIPSKQIK